MTLTEIIETQEKIQGKTILDLISASAQAIEMYSEDELEKICTRCIE